MVVNYKKLNPNAFYLLQYMQDVTLRYIVLYGGSSSAKSFSVAQTILIMTLYDGENTLVMRKVGASISRTIYEDFRVACERLGLSDMFRFVQNCCRCVNGARIDFTGLDDSEKVKGISNYKRVCLEELSEFELTDWKQIRKRLRGKEGQQIISTFNPVKESHWIKKDFVDVEQWHDVPQEVTLGGRPIPSDLCRVKSLRKNATRSIANARTGKVEEKPSNAVLIQTTYLNNFWVVGSPDGKYGYYDEQCVADFEYDRIHDPDYYNVYALGEWGVIRTGSEFFGSFNSGRHVKTVPYDDNLPVHISVDNNVLPYISISYWQYQDGTLRQFHETCAENPNNTVKRSAKLVAEYLTAIGYDDTVHVHGDASTKASNTFDDEKRSWMDLFISTLQECGCTVEDHVGTRNPSVPMSGEFINQIFDGGIDGLSIEIGDTCRNSVEDYQSVQKDVNGAILKTKVKNKTTGQSYEEHGHLSDTFRYMVVDTFRDEFVAFSNRRKRNLYAKDGAVRFFNPEGQFDYGRSLCYVMPCVGEQFVLVQVRQLGDLWHVVDAVLMPAASTDEMRDVILAHLSDVAVVECSESYFQFVKELRQSTTMTVKVLREASDVDGRIAATSDFVRQNVQFNSLLMAESDAYGQFMDNLFDYNRDSDRKQSSAALSGLAAWVMKKS
jgi:hypothetical protein